MKKQQEKLKRRLPIEMVLKLRKHSVKDSKKNYSRLESKKILRQEIGRNILIFFAITYRNGVFSI